jgi:ketosteroid isomerase-like protein
MKTTQQTRFRCIATFLILVFSSSLALADDEAEHAALRKIKAAYEAAVNGGDPSKIGPFMAKDATGVMVTGEPVIGLEGLKTYWKKIENLIGPGGSYQVKVIVEKSDLYGELAVSSGTTEDVVRLANGRELKFNSLWTTVCRKANGDWKLIRMQATMDPVDNVFISAKLKMAKLTFGVSGLVLGALLVFAPCLLRRKRA